MVIGPLLAGHLIAGIGVLTLGILQVFFMPRGTREHKKVGWFWAVLMAFLAFSSLDDLAKDGWLSLPGHVFTLATFILLPLAIWAARTGRIRLHKFSMFALCGIVLAATYGLLAVPGRLFNVWFLGGS